MAMDSSDYIDAKKMETPHPKMRTMVLVYLPT